MPRAIRNCRHCGIEIEWDGNHWREKNTTNSKCLGSVNGHSPPNALTKTLKRQLGK